MNVEQPGLPNNTAFSDSHQTTSTPSATSLLKQLFAKKSAIAIVLLIAIVAGGFALINTESIKINRAVFYIEHNKLSEASDLLYDLTSPKAVAARNFIEVEVARNVFLDLYKTNPDNIAEIDTALSTLESNFTSFKDFHAIYNIPEKLLDNFNCYDAALSYLNKVEAKYSYNFERLQTVLLNEVEMAHSSKNGKSFRLTDLQKRVDKTNEVLPFFEEWNESYFQSLIIDDQKVITYCKTIQQGETHIIYLRYDIGEMIDQLYSKCKSAAQESQEDINESLLEFSATDYLYRNQTDPSYEVYIGENLYAISDEKAIESNSLKLTRCLRNDLLYNLIQYIP